MAAIETRFGNIGVEERGGGGDGPGHAAPLPLVLLHGVGSDKRVWRPQLDHFGAVEGRRTIALDYPGYGESAAWPDATRDDFAAALWAALDALAVPRAHLCGLSLGGVVALAMAAGSPGRCASLTLADSFAVHPDGQGIYDRSTAGAAALGMRGLAEARAPSLLGPAAPDGLLDSVVETMAGIDPAAYALGARAVWLADQRERAAAVRLPTLVLCGSDDAITPPALSEDLARRIDGARLQLIERCGHLANAEQPAAFNAALGQFLSETERSGY